MQRALLLVSYVSECSLSTVTSSEIARRNRPQPMQPMRASCLRLRPRRPDAEVWRRSSRLRMKHLGTAAAATAAAGETASERSCSNPDDKCEHVVWPAFSAPKTVSTALQERSPCHQKVDPEIRTVFRARKQDRQAHWCLFLCPDCGPRKGVAAATPVPVCFGPMDFSNGFRLRQAALPRPFPGHGDGECLLTKSILRAH